MKEKEHQSIEWKESWQDEYLKWICGYANAYGGTIYIGTDDDGNVVGIDNARDLLERIPNKITDTMGIIADPIQISVYEDKIYIWNDGEMPPNLDSTDKLFMKHSSKPYNPKLANVFFKSGMIEAWGRGFEKIREACALYDGPLPEYEINEAGIMVLCKACDRYLGLLRDNGRHHGQCDQEGDHDEEQDIMRQIIAFCSEPKTASEIMQKFNLERSYFRRHYLNKMLKTGELQRTEPDKPKSKNQKYYS